MTVDKLSGDVTIRRQNPLSLEIKNAEGENLSVNAKNQIYLVGTENTKFNFSNFEHDTNSNVRLMTGNGIFTNNNTTINAKDLIAYGGKGNVGTKANPLRVNLSGSLDANSGDSVYVSSVSSHNLTIQAVAENNDVSLSSKKDMVMTTETGKTGGYISGKNISLNVATGNANESTLKQITELEKDITRTISTINSIESQSLQPAYTEKLLRTYKTQLKVSATNLKNLYSNVKLEGGIGAADDGLRINSEANTSLTAPRVSINAGGAIINNVGTGALYFDSISAPYGFGLKTPSLAYYGDNSFYNRTNEFFNTYRQGWQAPKFKYTVNELDNLVKQYA